LGEWRAATIRKLRRIIIKIRRIKRYIQLTLPVKNTKEGGKKEKNLTRSGTLISPGLKTQLRCHYAQVPRPHY